MNNIGNNIKKFRKQRGLSQDELANQVLDEKGMPLSRVTITRYENEREPSIEVLRKIASALNISIVELLTEDTYEAEETMMIELLIEKTINGTLAWDVLNRISTDDNATTSAKFDRILQLIESLPLSISFLDLKTSDCFFCSYNGIDYLLITYNHGKKELLIDTHETEKILKFEENIEGILDRLSEVAKNIKPATYRRGITKILDSLSGSNNND